MNQEERYEIQLKIDLLESDIEKKQKLLADLKEQMNKKIEITYGDLLKWQGNVYMIAKTPVFNGGKICAVRLHNDRSGSVDMYWLDVYENEDYNYNDNEPYWFAKVSSNSLALNVMENLIWTEGKYCKVVE